MTGAGELASRGEVSLARAAGDYHRRRVTWNRLAPAALAVGARLAIGRFGSADAVAAAAAVAVYGPLEWFGHHHVLHGLPIGPFEGRPDTPEAESHIAHHRAPDDLDLLFVQLDVVPTSVLALTAASLVAARWTPAPLTGLATTLTLMATYHWVHYLMHAPYEARSEWLATLERNHLAHHHTPEQWRMGVLFMTSDRVIAAVRSRVPDCEPSLAPSPS